MPIKFRCEHCKQLIGIAEIKAGSLVDCPTCGRTLRVPNKDGTVEPLPKPRVNHGDDGLRRALDELAQIGQAEEPSSQAGSVTALTPVGGSQPSAAAQPPNPTTVDRQANSVALEPLPAMQVVDPPAVRRPIPTRPPATPVRDSGTPEGILDEITVQSPARPPERRGPPAPAKPPVSLAVLIVACLCSLIVGAVGGYFFGRSSAPIAKPPAESAPQEQPAKPAVAGARITGRLTYLDDKDKLQPDAGACVLLLPRKPPVGQKLSSIGLRPGDDDVARQAAIASLEEQGGSLVQTDDQGQFQVEVREQGEYQLLALSHFHGRPADDAGNPATLATLGKYFDRPNQLVGQTAFQLKSIKHPGSGEVTWDCTFGEQAKK